MEMNDTTRLADMSTMSPARLLWRYCLPAVVVMLDMSLYNIIDRVFIGQGVGPEAIAGLAITFPVMNLSAALGVLIGAGGSARISILLGAGDEHGAKKVLGNALVMLAVIIVCYLTAFAVFIDDILMAFGASEVTLPYARDFMLYILPGMFMTNFAFTFNNFMRVTGYPVKAMVTMFIGAGINVILAPLFLFVMGWGIKGAAPSLVNAAACFINVIINKTLYQYGGDIAVAAAGIFTSYTSLMTMVVVGICQGMQPIVGFNYGAGLYHRLKSTYWLAVLVSTVIVTTGQIVTCVPR